jgi:hypothetical protein
LYVCRNCDHPQTYGYVVGWPGGQAKEVREWIKKNPNMTQGGTRTSRVVSLGVSLVV